MTAAERLLFLSKSVGSAGALLLAIGSGVTAEAALLDYSALDSVTAAEHLLYEKVSGHGGGSDSHVNLVKLRQGIKQAQEERARLEAERLAEIEREASEVLARIARENESEPIEPVIIPIPEAIEPTVKESFTAQFASVNDLVATLVEPLTTLDQSVTTFEELAIQNENDTIALLLILAEID